MARRSPLAIGAAAVLLAAGCAAQTASPSASDVSFPSIAPTPSAEPVVADVTRDGVRVTLTLEGPPRSGAPSWADLRIENQGQAAVRWAGGGCGDPGGIGIDVRAAFDPGHDWPGRLGRFKTLAMGLANPRFENPASAGYVEASKFGHDVACPASLRIEQLPVGAALSMRAGWDGLIQGVAAPVGPATVSGAFPFIGIQGQVANDAFDTKAIMATIETTVIDGGGGGGGVGGPAPLSPGLAIDAALADPQFAAWVEAAAENTWINPSVELANGVWDVGLFRLGDGAQRDMLGSVKVNPAGAIVGRRFEP